MALIHLRCHFGIIPGCLYRRSCLVQQSRCHSCVAIQRDRLQYADV